MPATCTLIRKAQPMGTYKPTAADTEKARAEFRLVAVGAKNSIVWANGGSELVTDRQLAKLQAAHVWATDF